MISRNTWSIYCLKEGTKIQIYDSTQKVIYVPLKKSIVIETNPFLPYRIKGYTFLSYHKDIGHFNIGELLEKFRLDVECSHLKYRIPQKWKHAYI